MARRKSIGIVASQDTPEFKQFVQSFWDNPLGFVEAMWEWDVKGGALEGETGPDLWQQEYLIALGEAVKARALDPTLSSYMRALVSGTNVGKTTLFAWIMIWFMSTRENAFITVTANTANQLRDTSWRELALWWKLALNNSWFEWTATKFYHKSAPDGWYAQSTPWSGENPEGFRGRHAKNRLVLFDEASAIEGPIWEALRYGLERTAIWLVSGNGTKNSGWFRECWRANRDDWATQQVDSRTAKRSDRERLIRDVERLGEDDDIVRVNILGLFPRSDNMQLIPDYLVERSQVEYRRRFGNQIAKALEDGLPALAKLKLDDNPLAPRIMSVDPAWMGMDKSVIGLRQGQVFVPLRKYRGLDGQELAYRVAECINALRPDVVFVDANGYGASCYDALKASGFGPTAILSSVSAMDKRVYFNRRTEMWCLMREWLKAGGMVPPPEEDKEIFGDLTTPMSGFSGRGTLVRLETKEEMRGRKMPSPDTGDTLAQTFFMPVAPSVKRDAAAALVARAWNMGRMSGASSGVSWMSN